MVNEADGNAIGLYHKLGFERVVPSSLETTLAAEKARSGRPRIVMRTVLPPRPVHRA